MRSKRVFPPFALRLVLAGACGESEIMTQAKSSETVYDEQTRLDYYWFLKQQKPSLDTIVGLVEFGLVFLVLVEFSELLKQETLKYTIFKYRPIWPNKADI